MKKAARGIKSSAVMPSHDREGLANGLIAPARRMPAQPIINGGQNRHVLHDVHASVATESAHSVYDSHQTDGALDQFDDEGHSGDASHFGHAYTINGQVQGVNSAQSINDLPYPIITALWRQRSAWVKSRTAMSLAAQARCRAFANGDKGEASKIWKTYCKGLPTDAHLAITLRPYSEAIKMFDMEIKPVEKQLGKLIKELPCYPWMVAIKGIGALYIAGIFGECGGPITKSHSVSALWKFFGLAVYDGKRQAFTTDKDENKRQSYNSRRRSLISQIETGFIMSGNVEYRAIYDERKEYELAKGVPRGHASNRAKRYAGKRFLRELWKHARKVEIGQTVYSSHNPNANLATDLNGHIREETHVCDAVQGESHYVYEPHVLDALPAISLEAA